jgi:hypothetical protein
MTKALAASLCLVIFTSTHASAQETTNQSSVSQGICSSGKNYWFQGKKLKDATLCTKFSFNQFFDIPILWDPKWNQEAKKHYCADSERDSCFIP